MKHYLILAFLFIPGSLVFAQPVKYINANDSWNADSLGNHRVVLHFNGIGDVAAASMEWRRKDEHPEEKRIIVVDATTNQRVLNVKLNSITRENGDIYFEPTSGAGDYYVYYMPYKNEGRSNYPKGVYLRPDTTASLTWLTTVDANYNIPQATVKAFEAINAFNSFYPMEIIATQKETNAIIESSSNKSFIVFPEDRMHSIKMKTDLPQRWIEKGIRQSFADTASKGENFAYQLGIFALKDLQNVRISFGDLSTSNGNKIAAKNISCLNTDGISYDDKPVSFTVNIPAKQVQPMWCLVNVPEDIEAGLYKGKAVVENGTSETSIIDINLYIKDEIVKDKGVNEPWKQTRLQWLNSEIAQENTVIKPYVPLEIKNETISLLGRKLMLNDDGLPKQIQTFFTEEMTDYSTKPNNLLTEPIHFHFIDKAGKSLQLKSNGFKVTKQTAGTVEWNATSTNDTINMHVSGHLEFDGFASFIVKVVAVKDVALSDIQLHIPFTKQTAKYMMGLGEKGEAMPDSLQWKWDVAHKNQDGAWIGNVNAGLQYSLRDEKYVRPLNTNFYLLKPLLLPASWGNNNKGGISIFQKGGAVLANNYSGERIMHRGDTLFYNFNLLITPFHTINTDFQWATRFYHQYNRVDSIKATGATVVNIHHATPINPYINYPFIAWKEMKAYIDSAHAVGLKVKIYNTVRELSNRAYELYALRSLGHEIYSPGKGGGFSWLQEHLDSDYIAAWFVPELKDAAIINSGMNRWHNYYVEGMNWLTQQVGIDGIYLDDVAFDRITMKRIKRVLTADGHPGIIDLHSANQYNKNDGFNNSANLYMEHFPYLNRLWFGEYFDYENNSPDFFLTEVSGIPFGLMGEMLQDGGNAWRGMIYGMTNRMPWSDDADPRPIWKVWDEFGMEGTKMIGYWSSNCPVKTTSDKVLATVYKKSGRALISIASWADEDINIQLKIDWEKLGINTSEVTITAPEIKNFQPAKTFNVNDKIPVQKNKGWLLIIK